MSNYSDQLSLIKVHTSVEVVVAAKDFDDAVNLVRGEYSDIVHTMMRDGVANVEIHELELIDELPETSPLRNYTPVGDEWGTQETCKYYTTVERNGRMKEKQEREEKIEQLIGGLDTKSLELLEVYFQDKMYN